MRTCWNNVGICDAQIQRLLQDVDKRDYQIETLKAAQNEGQKREENVKRQLDKLTYDKNSLQADLSSSRVELDEARQIIKVTLCHQIFGITVNLLLPFRSPIAPEMPSEFKICKKVEVWHLNKGSPSVIQWQ